MFRGIPQNLEKFRGIIYKKIFVVYNLAPEAPVTFLTVHHPYLDSRWAGRRSARRRCGGCERSSAARTCRSGSTQSRTSTLPSAFIFKHSRKLYTNWMILEDLLTPCLTNIDQISVCEHCRLRHKCHFGFLRKILFSEALPNASNKDDIPRLTHHLVW